MSFVHKTDVGMITSEINNLIVELRTTDGSDEKDITYLQNKYNYLFSTSNTLFKLIIKESLSGNLDTTAFTFKLNKMLEYICKIQQNDLTLDEASKKIGVLVADEYIPKDLYKGNDYEQLHRQVD